ncbi:MAG: transposase [Nitrospinota bacterium]|nr:MAG: transposase [Nitrospinota bacterium]
MARPLRIEYEGAVYHVTGRGNEQQAIYFTPADYQKFLEYIKTAQQRYGILLHAYVLMTNHYHLLIETPEANLSKAMHSILSGYTMYINKKKERSGHLFQGRFRSIVVEKDRYLVELSRYIHLNPVRAQMVKRPEDYPHSSYPCYIGKEKSDLLTTELVLSLYARDPKTAKQRYREFVESALGREIENPYNRVYGGMILGGESFIKDVLRRLKTKDLQREDISYRRELLGKADLEDIITHVALAYGLTVQEVQQGKNREARKVAIYLIKKHTAVTNREIGERFGGISPSAVSKVVERTEREIEQNRGLKNRLDKLIATTSHVKG